MIATMTVAEILAAIERLRTDAEKLARALQEHVRATAFGDMHGKIHRLEVVVREFAMVMAATPLPRC